MGKYPNSTTYLWATSHPGDLSPHLLARTEPCQCLVQIWQLVQDQLKGQVLWWEGWCYSLVQISMLPSLWASWRLRIPAISRTSTVIICHCFAVLIECEDLSMATHVGGFSAVRKSISDQDSSSNKRPFSLSFLRETLAADDVRTNRSTDFAFRHDFITFRIPWTAGLISSFYHQN